MITTFSLNGIAFSALNGGSAFTFTNSISLFIKSNNTEEITAIWHKLKVHGTILMDLGEYPWSKKYGWVKDKYGLSWQLFFDENPLQILPALLFVGNQFGNAEEAINLYKSIFKDSKINFINRFEDGNEATKGKIQYAEFTLANQKFITMESPMEHDFGFNEAFSFVIHCKNQDEVDYYWNSFIENGGKESQCGWLKDKYGISWQVVPNLLIELMNDKDKEKAKRVTNAMMQMKKIECKKLKEAYHK
ncbi:MAG: VOC family protein [Flavobacterium sp.]|nr:VOC family protein [Flavobacterium sp.]